MQIAESQMADDFFKSTLFAISRVDLQTKLDQNAPIFDRASFIGAITASMAGTNFQVMLQTT